MLDHDEQTLIAVLGVSADALQVNRTLQKQIGGHSGSNQRAPYSLTADGDEKRVSQDKRLLRLVRAQYLELKASVEAPADQPRIGPFTKAICRILPVSGGITAIAANSDQRGRAPIEAVLACAQVQLAENEQQQEQQPDKPPHPDTPPPAEYQPAPEGQPLDSSVSTTDSSLFEDSDAEGSDQIDCLKQAVEELQKKNLTTVFTLRLATT